MSDLIETIKNIGRIDLIDEPCLLQKLKELIEQGADVNVKDKKGNNLLHLAVTQWYSDLELFDILITKGVSINEKNKRGDTALHILLRDEISFFDEVKSEYFNDIEKVKKLIHSIQELYRLNNYQFRVFYDSLYYEILSKRDLNYFNVLDIAMLKENADTVDIIKILLNNDDDNCIKETMKSSTMSFYRPIYRHKYKKHKTSKDILDKDDKNPLSKSYSKTLN